jgi:WD40 repeat protein
MWKLEFSPDGQRLATAGWPDGMAAVWDLASGQATILTQEEPFIWGIAFNPDGSRVATVSPITEQVAEEIGVFEWDAATGEEHRMFPIDTMSAYQVTYSPDGGLLAAGVQEGNIPIWDTASGELVRTLTGHTALVSRLAFSPDGRRLASGASDNTVKLWDLATGQELTTMYVQSGVLNGMAASRDGTRIATAAADGTIRTYVVDTDELVAMARSRVTRSLTTEECQKYLHVEECPEP